MKIGKTVAALFVFSIVFIVLASYAHAQNLISSPTILPPRPDGGSALGQNQWYSVFFDGESDGIVAAKLTVQNTGKDTIDNVSIEIPGQNVRLINAMQEVQQMRKDCNNWQDVCMETDSSGACIRYERKCLSYYEYPVWPPYYYTLDRTQETLENSTRFNFNLSNPIDEQQTATILLYYKAQGYVQKSLGVWNFDFQTIKWNYDTSQIRVAVNVVEGLYLKGGSSNVNYQTDSGVYSKAEAIAPSAAGAQSSEMQQFSSQIEWQDGYVKTAQGLDPNETFDVRGSYSTSWLMLYATTIVGAIIVIAIVAAAAIYALKRVKLKLGIPAKIVLLGLVSSVLVMGVWFLLSYLLQNIPNIVGWQYQSMLTPLVILFGGVFMLIVLFGPSVYMGLKHGVMIGVFTLVSTLVWLFLLLIITIVLLVLVKPQPPIVYAKGVATAAASASQ